MKTRGNQITALSDVLSDLLRFHLFVIPPHHLFLRAALVNGITDHQIIVSWLCAAYSGAVGYDQHMVASFTQHIDEIDHNLFIINAKRSALFLHHRADGQTHHPVIVEIIPLADFFHHIPAALVVCHGKSPVRAKFNIFLNANAFQIFLRHLSSGADQLHFRKYPLRQHPVGSAVKCSHGLRILHHRNSQEHRHCRTDEGIGIHHKTAAVHKRNTRLIQHCIRHGICPKDFILQQKFFHGRTPPEQPVQDRERKCPKQQLLRLTGNHFYKIPGKLFPVFLRVYRHQINIQPFPVNLV